MAFAPRRRARRLWGYLRSERRTLRQGFVALLVSTGAALVAGITLGSITHTLALLPGLIILIPAANGMRGTIFGAIGARLGTSIQAGLFDVTRDRQGVLYQNTFVAVVTTFSSSIWLAALAKISATAFGLRSISFLDFVTISVVGGALGSAVVLGLTTAISIISFRRGYDLDAVSTPIVTAAGDMTTVPSLFLATFIVRVHGLNAAVAGVMIVVSVYATVRGALTDLSLARRIQLEMAAVIVFTPILDILAGTAVESHLDKFVALPGLLVIVPPLVSNAGALGGIYSSRISSKVHLGLISPSGWPESLAFLDAGLVAVSGVFAFTTTGALALLFSVAANKAHPGVGVMIGGTLLAGMISTAITIVVSYYIAIVTARFGLDPDNHAVPIITSVMDLAGVLTFLMVLSVLGVAPHG
ncbi:MAG TPA: magnesium transporter [Actinomycetota bacterium]